MTYQFEGLSTYCPYLVSSNHIRERQFQLLRRLRQELETDGSSGNRNDAIRRDIGIMRDSERNLRDSSRFVGFTSFCYE